MERIKQTCSCGASMEAESSMSSTVADRQEDFLKAHAICLIPKPLELKGTPFPPQPLIHAPGFEPLT